MHLWCRFYLSRPMFGEPQLGSLQSVITHMLPHWSAKLQVAKHENSKVRIAVGQNDKLYDSLHQAAPPKRGLGSAELSGAYPGVTFFLNHCEPPFPPELNMLSIEIYELSTVEGKTPSVWAREAFETIAVNLPVRYANARASEEYHAKNMVDDEKGLSAIGTNITHAAPGLYWLNFFGRPYVDLIGRECLLSAPAYEKLPIDDGILIGLDAIADAWPTPAYHQREQATIEHLGRKYFFSRHEPSRQTVAPNFLAYEKRATDP